ncbi:DUF4865 family protein [Saccharibacillus sacchari]|uniref:DUF4865 family protein n=1 Tax=Saccharibacillus sacchari TaxID=456493 RepID=UPI0004B078BF|nr:DUF4865 family protein [Saccharibacillus sacchari]
MIAMQYKIPLPVDYEMSIIRQRVQTNGHRTDGFRYLALKAYLISEKGKYGNFSNLYAPFYLWNDHDGMNEFLLNGPYDAILHSFGWQHVNIGIPLNIQIKHNFSQARWAVEITGRIPQTTSLNGFGAKLIEQLPKTQDAIGEALIYNPDKWGFSRFAFYEQLPEKWSDEAQRLTQLNAYPSFEVTIYEVIHVSQ